MTVAAGIAPPTDEELAMLHQQQALQLMQPPPDAMAASHGPVPAPNPLGDMARTADGVMAAPPPVPAAAPTILASAEPPPEAMPDQAPTAAPPAPVAPARHPGAKGGAPGLNTGAEERKLYGQQVGLGDQAVAAEQKLGDVRGNIAAAEATGADEKARLAAEHETQQNKVIEQANQQTQKWADRAQAETEKYMGMGLHDYWEDKSTGNRVLAGLSMMFGAAGRTDNEHNPGMAIINNAIDKHFRLQQAKIEKQKANVSMARDQYEIGLTSKQQALADNKLKESAAYDKVAAQLVALKMKQGVPLEQAQTDANVVALKQKANDTRMGILQSVHAQNVQDAHLGIEREKLGIERSKLGIEREKNRQGAQGLAQQRLEIQRDRLVNQDLAAWDRQNSVPKAIAARDKILDVREKLSDPNVAPATVASALMEFDTAARQGTATGASVQALQSHLAPGLFEKLKATAAHGSGNFTARERQELNKAVEAAVKASDDEGKRLHESFKSRFYGDPKLQGFKDQLGAESEGRFGRWGYESDATRANKAKQGGGAPAPPAPGPASGGRPPPEVIQQATAALRDPDAPPAIREKARQILIAAGSH